MKVTFKMEKATKNTIKFAEVLPEEGFPAPKIGTIYIPKSTLGELKWTETDNIVIEISKED